MSLPSGQYTLTSELGPLIGRRFAEDKSLNPKAIVTDSPDRDDPNVKWSFRALGGDKYELTVTGGPVGLQSGDRVYALLMGEPPAEWTITEHAAGEGKYTISTDGKYVTLTNSDLESQVSVSKDSKPTVFLIKSV